MASETDPPPEETAGLRVDPGTNVGAPDQDRSDRLAIAAERLADATVRLADAAERIAALAARLAPASMAEADPARDVAMRWDGERLRPVPPAAVVPLDRFVGVDSQIEALLANMRALKAGRPAHDMLLWGARGMGKSALIRACAMGAGLALVEASARHLETLPHLFERLAEAPGPFILFIDDLAFAAGDPEIRTLRSLLDGGVAARPATTRLAVTSNHRHLVARAADDTPVRHARDAADDALALVDRFGLVLGFHAASQEDYLAMCRGYLAAHGIPVDETDAIAFALARGGRSGRTAWHYRTEVLARLASENRS